MLYERLGFGVIGRTGTHVMLEWLLRVAGAPPGGAPSGDA